MHLIVGAGVIHAVRLLGSGEGSAKTNKTEGRKVPSMQSLEGWRLFKEAKPDVGKGVMVIGCGWVKRAES